MKDGLRNRIESGQHIASSAGVRLEAEERHRAVVEKVFEILDRRRVGEITLVVLQNDGQSVERTAVHAQIGLQALQGLQVVTLAVHLGVDDKDHAIRLAQHELERGVVSDLARHGVEMEGGLVPRDGISLHREEIEEQRPVLCCGKRNEIAAALGIELGVDLLDVGGLSTERSAAIDDLEADGVVVVVDAWHGL